MAGCATPGLLGLPVGGGYSQTTDSATSGCLRHPACYTHAPGEESVLPWLSRAGETARTAMTVMRLLDLAEVARVEQALVKCAKEADFKVNEADEELKGANPTQAQCKAVVRREGGQDVTRALDFGNKKHALALECVRRELGERFPDNLSLEPRYQMDPGTGRWGWLDPRQVAEWLKRGLASKLKGSLVPDIVLHALGNPNEVQRVYDFKFPCPASREPLWNEYPAGHPHYQKDQGEMYQQALGGQQPPKMVSPAYGIIQ